MKSLILMVLLTLTAVDSMASPHPSKGKAYIGARHAALALRVSEEMNIELARAAKFVDFLVPNRFDHGYGLSPEIVNEAKKEKDPDLIITVDNGISSIEGTSLARSFGIDVIITDHHLPPDNLPDANAIINPNLKSYVFFFHHHNPVRGT